MISKSIGQVLLRELASLRAEIEAYEKDEDVWTIPPGISNAAGTLALHLCGNLQHYVGAQLGTTSYVRDREAEFGRRNVARAELLTQIDAAAAAVEETMPRITAARLEEDFPEAVLGRTVNTLDFLIHLTSHLGYHLGQVDYHRRIVTGEDRPLPRMSIDGLRTT